MHGFTGRPWDADAGMYDYRARMYDPSSGRFATPDPAGLEDGDFNFYRYVGNGLQNATDPSGMFVKKLFRKVGKWFGRTLTRVFGEKAGRKIGGVLAFGAQVGLGLVLPGIGRAVGGAGRGGAVGGRLFGEGLAAGTLRGFGVTVGVTTPPVSYGDEAAGEAFAAARLSFRRRGVRRRRSRRGGRRRDVTRPTGACRRTATAGVCQNGRHQSERDEPDQREPDGEVDACEGNHLPAEDAALLRLGVLGTRVVGEPVEGESDSDGVAQRVSAGDDPQHPLGGVRGGRGVNLDLADQAAGEPAVLVRVHLRHRRAVAGLGGRDGVREEPGRPLEGGDAAERFAGPEPLQRQAAALHLTGPREVRGAEVHAGRPREAASEDRERKEPPRPAVEPQPDDVRRQRDQQPAGRPDQESCSRVRVFRSRRFSLPLTVGVLRRAEFDELRHEEAADRGGSFVVGPSMLALRP